MRRSVRRSNSLTSMDHQIPTTYGNQNMHRALSVWMFSIDHINEFKASQRMPLP